MTSRDKRPGELELPRTKEHIRRAVDDEIQAHLDERIAELEASGDTPANARERALREFGDVNAARIDLRRVDENAARTTSVLELFQDLITDARRALRSLARRPAFTAVAVGTLALGIGANAVMFGLIDRLLLSGPPHVQHPAELSRLRFNMLLGGNRISWVRGPQAVAGGLAARSDVFAGVGGYSDVSLTLAVGEQALELNVAAVTPNFFPVLGVSAAAGRLLSTAANDRADDRSVVLSHALWMQLFGGAPSAVGKQVRLGGEIFTVVGIAPRGFSDDSVTPSDAWIQLGSSTPTFGPDWQRAGLFTFARLRAGVPMARAQAEANRIYRAGLAETRAPDSTARVEFRSMLAGRDSDNGALTPSARVAMWLQAVSLLVLLIAIANVVNLLLLRAIERQRETAVCLALGITRARLIRHLSLESFMLALAGGVLAVALARWLGPTLWTVVVPASIDVGAVAGRFTGATAAVAAVCAVVMTIVPAIVQRAASGSDALRGGTRGGTQRASKLGESLVVLQVALTVVLLVGAGLFVRSVQRLAAVDLGFRPERVVGARLNPGTAATTDAERAQLFARVEEALERVPGVSAVSVGLSAPFRPSLNAPLRLPGKDKLPGIGQGGFGPPTYFAISPDFLTTFGIRVLRGRAIEAGDRAGSARVMLVDATMARTFWPNEDPIGRCVQVGADSMPCTTVVGVVQDTRRALTERQHSLRYYLPIEQSPYQPDERYFFIQTGRANVALVNAVRATIASTVPSAPFVESFLMERQLDVYTQQWRLGTTAFVSFGVLATVIATIGLFGVVSFGVARRERELGIRRALGESRASVLRRVVFEASARSGVGLLAGGVLSYALGRRLQELLFRPEPGDAVVFGLAAAIVLAATLVASAGPALRAVRADPMRALRAE